ncbi:MFS transporter [Coralloluteibacterium stylophorae]|uniref:MFS transporter n=1 Tax=Coralloluteibacterium stylophorae TaxID=1776034 RepID=A0AAP2CCU5_9GAMM|nr:MFS transporter [Coralloluteibacterium stylophorae]MBS7457162.1 MFS transporter [Coralloluteibacterium stylophorae]
MDVETHTAEATAADPRRWLALAVLLTGTLLPPLDFFIVNVALPAIRADLGASADVSQLVISVYAAAYAVTLILGGRLGDLHGRKRVFLGGMLGFGIASTLCGLAPSPGVLVAGRLLQGISAAVMAPQSLASIHALFPAGEKSRALSLYGATFGLASVAGQLLGGVLVSASPWGLGWRSVFLVNLPVIALAVPAALALMRESRPERAARLDVRGALLLAAGLLALVVPVIEGREHRWPWWCLALLGVSGPLLLVFWRHEVRQEAAGGTPLILPSLLAVRGLRRSLASTFFFYALAAFFLVFAIYEQAGLGRDAFAAGLAILPLGIGFLLGPLCSPRIAAYLGPRTAAFGMVLEVLGLVMAATLVGAGAPSWLALPLFAIGAGQGIALPALVRSSVDHVDARWAGLASGLVNATLQIGAAIWVAMIGGVFFAIAPDGAGAHDVRLGFAAASLAIAAALAVAAALGGKRRPSAAGRADGMPAPEPQVLTSPGAARDRSTTTDSSFRPGPARRSPDR